MKTFISDISMKEFPLEEKVAGSVIRKAIFDCIKKENPTFSEKKCISISELNYFREKYIVEFIGNKLGNLSELENTVLNALSEKSILTEQLNEDDEKTNYTFGQRIADKVATFGGSWTFILSFGVFLAFWIFVNFYFLRNKGFDPYPFILLNLILSCIAALQAPVIMMSQNRQEEKDRERSKQDYMVNLKSELEIRILHEKLDHLIMHQQQEMLEIQKVQLEMMDSILNQLKKESI